ncbi:MAG: asparagine synthase [Nitrososphaerales archaeon]|nr:asparagine synthase [Nitrososphaerales archaeon]
MMRVDEICDRLCSLLQEAVLRNLSESLLLSGGLDTSIIAYIASQYTRLKAFTVALNTSSAPDVEYAKMVAGKLGLDHTIHLFDERDFLSVIPIVIKTLKTFDPMEIRNSAPLFIALREAKERGTGSVMTGDGSDELFAGYSFLFNLEKSRLEDELIHMWSNMSFSSIPLGKYLNVDVKLPYLDPNLKSYVMRLDSGYKIRNEGDQIWGKWILRKAFERMIPEAVAWRVKMPIEYGSGTNLLTGLFEKRIEDSEFEERRRRYIEDDRVIVRNKEQLYYYEIYRSAIGVPQRTRHGKSCHLCNSDVPEVTKYCKVCGAYPT